VQACIALQGLPGRRTGPALRPSSGEPNRLRFVVLQAARFWQQPRLAWHGMAWHSMAPMRSTAFIDDGRVMGTHNDAHPHRPAITRKAPEANWDWRLGALSLQPSPVAPLPGWPSAVSGQTRRGSLKPAR
jgi:hypothetical protein